MYLAGTTFGGAGGAATLTLGAAFTSCASCGCGCAGGGTGVGESPIWRWRCARAGPGARAAASSRSDSDLLTNFIFGTSFREARNFLCPLKTQLAHRSLPNQRFFQDAEPLPLGRLAGRLELRDDRLDQGDGERARVRERL